MRYDSIPQVLDEAERLEVRRAVSGRTSLHVLGAARAEAPPGSDGACAIEDYYLNGRLVRQRFGSSEEASMVRRFEPRVVSGLEVFEGRDAPVGANRACGAVLYWVSTVRSPEDPDFSGTLVGRIVAPDPSSLEDLAVRAEPGGHVARVDARGAFDFGALPPAHYTLEVEVDGVGVLRQPVDVRAFARSSALIEILTPAMDVGSLPPTM